MGAGNANSVRLRLLRTGTVKMQKQTSGLTRRNVLPTSHHAFEDVTMKPSQNILFLPGNKIFPEFEESDGGASTDFASSMRARKIDRRPL
jgi:hypothetical protein